MSWTSPVTMWRKWRGLDQDERATFRQAFLLVPAMHIAVRVIGFNRLQQRVTHTTSRENLILQSPDQLVRRCAVNISRVKHYSVWRGNCLSQSLALMWLLRRRGVEPTLKLGVRLAGPKFDAHAWVEFDGRVLNDTQDVHTRFTPFVEKSGTR